MRAVGIHIDRNIFLLYIRSFIHVVIGAKSVQAHFVAIGYIEYRTRLAQIVVRPLFPDFRIHRTESPALSERERTQVILSAQTEIKTDLVAFLERIVPVGKLVGIFNGKNRLLIAVALPFQIVLLGELVILYIRVGPQIAKIAYQIVPADSRRRTLFEPRDHFVLRHFTAIGQRQRLFPVISGIEKEHTRHQRFGSPFGYPSRLDGIVTFGRQQLLDSKFQIGSNQGISICRRRARHIHRLGRGDQTNVAEHPRQVEIVVRTQEAGFTLHTFPVGIAFPCDPIDRIQKDIRTEHSHIVRTPSRSETAFTPFLALRDRFGRYIGRTSAAQHIVGTEFRTEERTLQRIGTRQDRIDTGQYLIGILLRSRVILVGFQIGRIRIEKVLASHHTKCRK